MKTERIFPPRLDKTKLIGVIAPADPVAGVCSTDVIRRGYEYLKERGFSIIEGESVKSLSTGHTAGSINLRVNDIHEFVKRDDVGCIMAFWGGFNTNQLLDHLDYELIRSHPKIFIGYSDVTALTTAITTKTGLVTFSGPGIISFAKPEPFEYTWAHFERMCVDPVEDYLVGESPEYADDLYFLRDDPDHRIRRRNDGIKMFKGGSVSGEVIVGNLQTILVLSGTEYFPDMKGKILFIEEDETSTVAHVDRFLTQCRQTGWFDEMAGLVLGRFTEHSGFTVDDSLENLLEEQLSDAKFPILYDADFGHSDPLMTIPNGGITIIDADNKRIVFKKSVI
ncbi:MAG: S66 peptidase family protein [Candidatus Moraniibacteriota bacterium]